MNDIWHEFVRFLVRTMICVLAVCAGVAVAAMAGGVLYLLARVLDVDEPRKVDIVLCTVECGLLGWSALQFVARRLYDRLGGTASEYEELEELATFPYIARGTVLFGLFMAYLAGLEKDAPDQDVPLLGVFALVVLPGLQFFFRRRRDG